MRLVTGPLDTARGRRGHAIGVAAGRRGPSRGCAGAVPPASASAPAARRPKFGSPAYQYKARPYRRAHMAKYDGLLGQPVLEVEEPDKEGGITVIFKDNRFLFIKAADGKVETVSIPE